MFWRHNVRKNLRLIQMVLMLLAFLPVLMTCAPKIGHVKFVSVSATTLPYGIKFMDAQMTTPFVAGSESDYYSTEGGTAMVQTGDGSGGWVDVGIFGPVTVEPTGYSEISMFGAGSNLYFIVYGPFSSP
jgi:hypothetical protein